MYLCLVWIYAEFFCVLALIYFKFVLLKITKTFKIKQRLLYKKTNNLLIKKIYILTLKNIVKHYTFFFKFYAYHIYLNIDTIILTRV